MAKTPNRTRPLDRDGDGNDGGSLPGNQTAPMADTAGTDNAVDPGNPDFPDQGEPNSTATPPTDNGDELADVRTAPGDSQEKLDAINRETDEANAAAAAARAGDGDQDDEEDPHEACSRCTDEHPAAMLQCGLCANCVDEEDDEDEALASSVDPALITFAETDTDLPLQTMEDHGYTFDTEQVEAAQPRHLSLDQVKATLETAPSHAFRLSELQTLASSRFLYKSKDGYSPTYAAPFVSEEVAAAMIAAGLAIFDEDAGNTGALRPTSMARYALADAQRPEGQA